MCEITNHTEHDVYKLKTLIYSSQQQSILDKKLQFEKMKTKLSFDYDHTLSTPEVQSFVASLDFSKYDIWIVTSRCPDSHSKVFAT